MLQDFLSHLFLLCLPPAPSTPPCLVCSAQIPLIVTFTRGTTKKQHTSWRCKKHAKFCLYSNLNFLWSGFRGMKSTRNTGLMALMAPPHPKSLQGIHHKGHFLRTKGMTPLYVQPSMRCTLKINEDRQLSRQQRNRIYRKKLIFQPQSRAKFT